MLKRFLFTTVLLSSALVDVLHHVNLWGTSMEVVITVFLTVGIAVCVILDPWRAWPEFLMD